jgi:hypothetical protein
VKSARHVREHAQRGLIAVGHPRDILAHRVVEVELLLVGEDQEKRRGEGLGDAADTKVILDPHGLLGLGVGHTACADIAPLARDPDADDDPWHLRRCKGLPQREVDSGPLRRRKGVGRLDVGRKCGGRHREQHHHQIQREGASCAKETQFRHGFLSVENLLKLHEKPTN